MHPDSPRWVRVSPSRYPHEDAGLRYIGEHLPDADPYRLWTNLVLGGEEVDALVLGPAGLYLLELKFVAGRITGDDFRWVIDAPGRQRPEEMGHPFTGAVLKAKKLSSYLRRKALEHERTGRRESTVPWVHAAVFLHHPEVRYEISQQNRTVFGLDAGAAQPGLTSIISLLTRRAFGGPGPAGIPGKKRTVTPLQAADLTTLMAEAGLTRPVARLVADYRLDDRPIADGPGWQEFVGTLSSFPTDKKLVRWYNTASAEGTARRAQLGRAAQREYALGLAHDGILSPLPGGFHDDPELGPALIYPYDPQARRLDELVSDCSARLSLPTRLRIILQIADALRYAHGQGITHRGLSPRSVLVRLGDDGDPAVKVSDWQGAADPDNAESLLQGTTDVAALLSDDARWYRAPETGWASRPDQVRADVFSLGAVAYRVLGGSFPAADPAAYLSQLRAEGGLRLDDKAGPVPRAVTDLVYDATRVVAADRIPDLDTFAERLDAATSAISAAGLAPQAVTEPPAPRHPAAGDILAGRWRVIRELGSGSTARAFLVADVADGDSRKVLKIARGGPEAAARLRDEARTLTALDHPSVVRLAAGPLTIDDMVAIVTDQAGERTLEALLNSGPLAADQLERLGDDLLETSAYLAGTGAVHRDIKPANLGVRGGPAGPGLVLFDFSHASAPLDDLDAGTRGYRDPFLSRDEVPGLPFRPRWDQAAEQYSVAVTLFRMATGEIPRYGNGQSHPQVVPDEASISTDMFTSVPGSRRDELAGFFRRALYRDAGARFPTIAAMRTAWTRVFHPEAAESRAGPDARTEAAAAPEAAPPERGPLPGTVRYAVWLTYAAAWAGVLGAFADLVNWGPLRLGVQAQFAGAPPSEIYTAMNVVPAALLGAAGLSIAGWFLVAWAVRHGRNWGRIVGASLFLAGSGQVVSLYYATHFWRQLVVPQIWLIASCLAGFCAAALLWQRSADALFRPAPDAAPGVSATSLAHPAAGDSEPGNAGVATWLGLIATLVLILVLVAVFR